MQGTNRSGEGGEKSLLCDTGSELRLGGREKKKGDNNKWDDNTHTVSQLAHSPAKWSCGWFITCGRPMSKTRCITKLPARRNTPSGTKFSFGTLADKNKTDEFTTRA